MNLIPSLWSGVKFSGFPATRRRLSPNTPFSLRMNAIPAFRRNYINIDDVPYRDNGRRAFNLGNCETSRARSRFRIGSAPWNRSSETKRTRSSGAGGRRGMGVEVGTSWSIANGINYSLFTSEASVRLAWKGKCIDRDCDFLVDH